MSPRPYQLGQRKAASDQTRARILSAARDLLMAPDGYSRFSIETVARQADVARMTVYHQFGSKTGLLEGLCDSLAVSGGMKELASAFQQPEPLAAFNRYIEIFGHFWEVDRLVMRRLRALAALDPDFEQAIRSRDEWIQKPLKGDFELGATAAHPNKDSEFRTDKGRRVTGGGGIQPDFVVQPPPTNRLRVALDLSASFTNFATEYLRGNKIDEDFEVTPALLDQFHTYVAGRNIQPRIAEWVAEREFISNRLKTEIFNQAFGVEKGDQVEAQRDPLIQKALEVVGS